MAAFDYANCVIHLRADNAGSSTIIDEINGSGVWTFAGTAIQSAISPIAGAGSFDISNNDDTHFIRSTNAGVLAGLTFNTSQDWCVRFKYRAYNWTNFYAAVLGSGPGNPVFTFRDNGNEFAIPDHSFTIPGGAQTLGTAHEIEISRVSGRVYAFHDGTLMNPGGDAQADAYPTQTEWFICHQPHAPEFFDGWVDEVQVFKGVGGHTASYTAAINTPFPGGSSDVTLALTGNAGSAAVGTVSLAVDKALTGNGAAGAVGTVVQSLAKALTNNVGTGAVGTVAGALAIGVSSATATGDVGQVAVEGTADITIALTGVEAASGVGDAGDSTDVALSGVAGVAAVGDVTPSVAGNVTVALTGVTGLGEVGSVSVQGDAPGRPIVEFVQGAGRTIRQVTHQPLLQRILAQRRAERYKPSRERAAKRAKVIEVQAAQTVLDGGGEASFRALMNEWLEQRPVLPIAEPPSQAFMAQVAFRIQQMQQEQQALAALAARQDDEDAVIALLLA